MLAFNCISLVFCLEFCECCFSAHPKAIVGRVLHFMNRKPGCIIFNPNTNMRRGREVDGGGELGVHPGADGRQSGHL